MVAMPLSPLWLLACAVCIAHAIVPARLFFYVNIDMINFTPIHVSVESVAVCVVTTAVFSVAEALLWHEVCTAFEHALATEAESPLFALNVLFLCTSVLALWIYRRPMLRARSWIAGSGASYASARFECEILVRKSLVVGMLRTSVHALLPDASVLVVLAIALTAVRPAFTAYELKRIIEILSWWRYRWTGLPPVNADAVETGGALTVAYDLSDDDDAGVISHTQMDVHAAGG